jgi:hypothetical protein
MFHLSYDAKHKVLLSSFSGTYGSEDITLRDSAVRRFVAKSGLCHGIMDLSAVDYITVSLDLLISRSHQPAILQGHQRVIVAPRDPALSFARLVAAHQLFARKEEPALVASMPEAYDVIGISEPKFDQVPSDAAAQRERLLHELLRNVDKATTDGAWESFTSSLQRVIGRRSGLWRNITLTDLLNVELGRSVLLETDVRTSCASCRQAFLLYDCSIVSGRTTTYVCPNCRAWMVKITSIAPTEAASSKGYVLGVFEFATRTDLHIAGARLPRTESS